MDLEELRKTVRRGLEEVLQRVREKRKHDRTLTERGLFAYDGLEDPINGKKKADLTTLRPYEDLKKLVEK